MSAQALDRTRATPLWEQLQQEGLTGMRLLGRHLLNTGQLRPALAAHEVKRDLAPVQAAADATERGHHASFAGLVRAGTRAAGRGEARHGARAPSRLGSSPDSGCPCP